MDKHAIQLLEKNSLNISTSVVNFVDSCRMSQHVWFLNLDP